MSGISTRIQMVFEILITVPCSRSVVEPELNRQICNMIPRPPCTTCSFNAAVTCKLHSDMTNVHVAHKAHDICSHLLYGYAMVLRIPPLSAENYLTSNQELLCTSLFRVQILPLFFFFKTLFRKGWLLIVEETKTTSIAS